MLLYSEKAKILDDQGKLFLSGSGKIKQLKILYFCKIDYLDDSLEFTNF